jgi:hypothetical protein
LDAVVVEVALEDFAVGEFDLAATLFGVFGEVAFVVLPVVFQQVEVGVVEGACQSGGVVVVDLPCPAELVLHPISLIGQFPAVVVEFPVAFHPVMPPPSLIIPAVLVVEFPQAVSHPVAFVAFVPAAGLVLLRDVLEFSLVVGLEGAVDRIFVLDFDYG